MGKLRKIGRKIKKGVKKLFSSKIGKIVGMVGLYFALGAAAKGLSSWFSSSFGKAGAVAAETTAVAAEGAAAGAGAGASAGASASGGASSGTIGSVVEGASTASEGANAVIASVDSAAINGSTTASSTITDAVTNVTESNILDQSVVEVNNNLVLKENMIGSDMLAENTIKPPKLNFMEGVSKDVTQLPEQVDLTPPIGELEGFDKVRQAGSNVRKGAREYFIGDESTFVPDTISGVGSGLIAQQFAPDEEPMGGGYIAPQPAQVQAQGAYIQEVGPMMSSVTGVPNFSNFTQMANQNVYGIGTPNHLAGLYG